MLLLTWNLVSHFEPSFYFYFFWWHLVCISFWIASLIQVGRWFDLDGSLFLDILSFIERFPLNVAKLSLKPRFLSNHNTNEKICHYWLEIVLLHALVGEFNRKHFFVLATHHLFFFFWLFFLSSLSPLASPIFKKSIIRHTSSMTLIYLTKLHVFVCLKVKKKKKKKNIMCVCVFLTLLLHSQFILLFIMNAQKRLCTYENMSAAKKLCEWITKGIDDSR